MNETHGLTLKRITGYTAIVVSTLAILFVLYRLGEVVLLFVLSIVVAAALHKGVIALESRGVPRSLAILFWYVVVIGVLGLGIYVLGGALKNELQTISEELPQRYDVIINHYQQHGTSWEKALAQRLPDTNTVIRSLGQDGAAEIGFEIAGFTSGILSTLISLVIILTLTFYWLADQEHFERLWLSLLPVQQRAIARNTWQGIEYRVGAYVRSEITQFALTIALLWFALNLLHAPFPTLYAIYGGIVQLIPWVGIPLALLPLALMLFSTPLWMIVVIAAVIIVLGIFMDQIIEPRLRGDAVVHPILTVLALMIMGELSGILGMVIALPLAATFQIVLNEVVRFSTVPRTMTASAETTQLKNLRDQFERLRETIPEDEEHRREVEGILARVEDLMDRTEDVVRERVASQRGALPTARRRLPLLSRTRPSSR
ncbi:MAG TPA: AI-2E family transporter [Herpetosiphonaceae bacterium]|nr:AI-2E family transporter [Herpetosiphonaceae bacterium]